MISTKIYKQAIQKEEEKIYDLWWKKLQETQKQMVDEVLKIFKNWYNIALEEIKNNTELKLMWQAQTIEKYAKDDDSEELVPFIETAFILWMEQLTFAFQKDPQIDIIFNIKNQDALDYAKYQAWELITQIDDYTKVRISKLIEKALENWWWYDKIANILQTDYSFSKYRATLIASNELWNSYLAWKEHQFDKYRKEYNEAWYKNWISHRDSNTTPWCLHNDLQGWIKKDKDFESPGRKDRPTRFPGCRCNIVYRLFKPEEERLDSDNATESDKIQANIKTDNFDKEDIESEA